MYKIQKYSSSNEYDNKRFFICTNYENEYWENLLLDYRCNRDESEKDFFYKSEQSDNLTLEEQLYLLTSIPNDHFWSWYNQITTDIKFEQRLPTCVRYFPGSPRNRIILILACCYRENPEKIVSAVFEALMGKNDTVVPYPKKTVSEVNHTVNKNDLFVPCSKKKGSWRNNLMFIVCLCVCIYILTSYSPNPLQELFIYNRLKFLFSGNTYRHHKRSFSKISIDSGCAEEPTLSADTLPLSQNTSSVRLNLFQYYCGQLFNHGVLKWRIIDENIHTVLMNDYDSVTGDFLVFVSMFVC
ncbi:uncharacterized protein LOC136077009 isoform X1 [Hydra vulgaris]|uniref:Uncharacterized protein LOC136077009 isoform X1 n=1 Tax=Hydra vulgaris TaxID=6087 RepID=A0ABM4BE90_HYDVU